MKSEKVYILHIIESIDRINEYIDKIQIREFKESRLIQDAVIRNFEIIGEATKQISSNTRKKYPKIPWKNMAGMRDKLIHNYMGVDLDAVWNTIIELLPTLKKDLGQVAESIDDSTES